MRKKHRIILILTKLNLCGNSPHVTIELITFGRWDLLASYSTTMVVIEIIWIIWSSSVVLSLSCRSYFFRANFWQVLLKIKCLHVSEMIACLFQHSCNNQNSIECITSYQFSNFPHQIIYVNYKMLLSLLLLLL